MESKNISKVVQEEEIDDYISQQLLPFSQMGELGVSDVEKAARIVKAEHERVNVTDENGEVCEELDAETVTGKDGVDRIICGNCSAVLYRG